MLRRHRPVQLNWFRAIGQISNGVVVGGGMVKSKAKLTSRKAFGSWRPARAKECPQSLQKSAFILSLQIS